MTSLKYVYVSKEMAISCANSVGMWVLKKKKVHFCK